jgi:hypothetical protein
MPVERRAEEVKNGARGGTEMAQRDQIRQEPQKTAVPSTSAQGGSGAAATPDGDGPDDTVSRTFRQKAMYENLMEEVASPENYQKALQAVVANDGAAGIDGMKATDLKEHLEAHWGKIQAKLLAGTYVPTPVKRVEIPKPSGGVRMLGIPTVLDRFIQQLLLQAMTPIFEPLFSDHSYGFRPGRPTPSHCGICTRNITGKSRARTFTNCICCSTSTVASRPSLSIPSPSAYKRSAA